MPVARSFIHSNLPARAALFRDVGHHRVLEYVCAHGHLPDDDDDNGGEDGSRGDGNLISGSTAAAAAQGSAGTSTAGGAAASVAAPGATLDLRPAESGAGTGAALSSTCKWRAPLATVVDDFLPAPALAAVRYARARLLRHQHQTPITWSLLREGVICVCGGRWCRGGRE